MVKKLYDKVGGDLIKLLHIFSSSVGEKNINLPGSTVVCISGSLINKNFADMKSGSYKMTWAENPIMYLTLHFLPKSKIMYLYQKNL